MLHNKTTTNDFNLPVAFRPFPHKGLADELWANRFFSNHGPAPSLGFPQMRQTISWRPKNTKILLHGPISLHGIRSIDLPGELARHRSMPARQPVETLSHGHSIPKGLEPSTFGSTVRCSIHLSYAPAVLSYDETIKRRHRCQVDAPLPWSSRPGRRKTLTAGAKTRIIRM